MFCSLFSIENTRTHVIEHGIDRPTCLIKPVSQYVLNIAYLGAFTVEKGAQYFLALARKFADSQEATRVNFHIIGELGYPIPGDINNHINISVVGSYRPDELNGLLSRGNIDLALFFPIWPETYSYTLSESVMNGIPVIASDIGALRERVSEKSLGLLVPFENPVPYAKNIIEDFLKYPELLEYFRQQCSAYVKDMPDVREMGKQHGEIYTASAALPIRSE